VARLCLDQLGELTAFPKPHSWIKGSLLLSKRMRREWREGEDDGVEEKRNEWRGKGERRREVRVEAPYMDRYAPAVA